MPLARDYCGLPGLKEIILVGSFDAITCIVYYPSAGHDNATSLGLGCIAPEGGINQAITILK